MTESIRPESAMAQDIEVAEIDKSTDVDAPIVCTLAEPDRRERAARLLEAMPPVARAALDDFEGRPWSVLEDALRGRSDLEGEIEREDWGWIEVDAVRLLGDDTVAEADLTRRKRYAAPDDGKGSVQRGLRRRSKKRSVLPRISGSKTFVVPSSSGFASNIRGSQAGASVPT